jgi:hypothetical protein
MALSSIRSRSKYCDRRWSILAGSRLDVLCMQGIQKNAISLPHIRNLQEPEIDGRAFGIVIMDEDKIAAAVGAFDIFDVLQTIRSVADGGESEPVAVKSDGPAVGDNENIFRVHKTGQQSGSVGSGNGARDPENAFAGLKLGIDLLLHSRRWGRAERIGHWEPRGNLEWNDNFSSGSDPVNS